MFRKIYNVPIFLLTPFLLLAAPEKYPIYTLGIKFEKPTNYFLATSETKNDLKKSLFSSNLICSSAKKAIEISFSKPNFKLFLNDESYNEQIYFYKIPKFKIGKEVSKSAKDRIKEQCFIVGYNPVTVLRDTSGVCPIGIFTALLFKIITPEITYYSEGFFIEGSTGTLIVTINSQKRKSNFDLINSIENISSERFENLISEINELMSLKNYKMAELKVDTCVNLDPKNVRGYDKRMAINLYHKKYHDVIKDADLIMKIDENYLNGLIVKGLAYYSLNEYSSAINCFELAQNKFSILTLDNLQNDYYSSFSQLYRLKGEAFIKLKNIQMAIENLEAALRLSIDSFNTGAIYYNIGVVKSSLVNNADEAIQYYTLAINNYPFDKTKEKSEAFFNRGVNYRKKKREIDAMSDYSNAIKIRPDYAKAYNNRAAIKLNTEDYKGAIADCTAAIKYDKEMTEVTGLAYYNRGVAKLNLNDINGCRDIKTAKSMGQQVPKELLEGCNIK